MMHVGTASRGDESVVSGFETLLVEDSGILDAVLRLRHRVFVEELGFFGKSAPVAGRERDPWDGSSAHIATIDGGGRVVGTLRLVLDGPFPAERYCRFFDGGPELSDDGVAEISRLCIAPELRSSVTRPSVRGRVVKALYREMTLQSVRLGITHWLAAMERGLYTNLERLGCCFDPIGPEVDYYGPVVPYLGAVEDNLKTLRAWGQRPETSR